MLTLLNSSCENTEATLFPCLFPHTIYSFSLSFLLFLPTSGEKLERPRQSYTFAMLLNKEPLNAEEFVR